MHRNYLALSKPWACCWTVTGPSQGPDSPGPGCGIIRYSSHLLRRLCVASPRRGPLPLPTPPPSPATAWADSPLASGQHLALHNLTEHFKAPLQLSGAHVTGEIPNIHHTAFTLFEKKNTEMPSHCLASWDPLDGWLLWSPRPQPVTPGQAGDGSWGWSQREDDDDPYPRRPALLKDGAAECRVGNGSQRKQRLP